MKDCRSCRNYLCSPLQEPCESCLWDVDEEPSNWEAPTNADKFRAMTDEELAKAFVAIAAQKRPSTYTAEGFCLDDGEVSETDWLDWLKAPASKEEQT